MAEKQTKKILVVTIDEDRDVEMEEVVDAVPEAVHVTPPELRLIPKLERLEIADEDVMEVEVVQEEQQGLEVLPPPPPPPELPLLPFLPIPILPFLPIPNLPLLPPPEEEESNDEMDINDPSQSDSSSSEEESEEDEPESDEEDEADNNDPSSSSSDSGSSSSDSSGVESDSALDPVTFHLPHNKRERVLACLDELGASFSGGNLEGLEILERQEFLGKRPRLRADVEKLGQFVRNNSGSVQDRKRIRDFIEYMSEKYACELF